MVQIDNKKMWESLLQMESFRDSIISALKDQGLTINANGQIVQEDSTIFKIEADKWYLCIRDFLLADGTIAYKEGTCYQGDGRGCLKNEFGGWMADWNVYGNKYFRPATEEEIAKHNLQCNEFIRMMEIQKPIPPEIQEIINNHFDEMFDDSPKFKVGNWITDGSHTLLIKEVLPLDYSFQRIDGSTGFDSLSHVDEYFRLWTIQDSKDGDVLADDKGFIMLVDESRNSKFGYRLSRHCAVLSDGRFTTDNVHTRTDGLYPATKEQRDLLFQKMKGAGYEWNPGEKRLIEVPKIKEETGVFEESEQQVSVTPPAESDDVWNDGTKLSSSEVTNKSNQDELTEFEQVIYEWLYPNSNDIMEDEVERVKLAAKDILSAAHKELVKDTII